VNGAEALLRTAVGAGVDLCLANPGTTEMPLVQALDAVPGVRAVLGLFEGVCTGAADGYGRMTGRPAMTLLHLGPGFANGLANLHNARRARSPVFNVVGDHATWHVPYDAPLSSDIVSLARPMSGWVRSVTSPGELADQGAAAIAAAQEGRVSTLIVPADCQWGPAEGPVPPHQPGPRPAVDDDVVAAAAAALDGSEPACLFLGGAALGEAGLRAAGLVAASTGCALMVETFPARMERGGGLPALARLPYFPEQASQALAAYRTVVLVGAVEPVAFFGYRDVPSSTVPPTTRALTLAAPDSDVLGALAALAERVGDGSGRPAATSSGNRPDLPGDAALDPVTIGAVLAALQPEGAIVVDEANTTGLPYNGRADGAPSHSYLSLTGGAIGQGAPAATGAALACPDRPVIDFQADGSFLYTMQSLWTQAREGLDVTTLVCANRTYRILQAELWRAGVSEPGAAARGLTDLASPTIDFTAISTGLGVPASRATTTTELAEQLRRALAEPGPHLVEMVL